MIFSILEFAIGRFFWSMYVDIFPLKIIILANQIKGPSHFVKSFSNYFHLKHVISV